MRDKNNLPVEPAKMPAPHRPMNTWKHMVAYLCIWFLVVVLLMVYFTSTGSPQAGLLEVGACALIFVVLFHLVMKFFPLVSKIITSVIIIGFGIALIYVNYHFLRVVKKDASLEQLLVGDLLVNKIMKTIRKEPIVVTPKEIPKAAPEPKSLDQLKITLADPTVADLALSQITTHAPAIKEGAMFSVENSGIETADRKRNMDVSGLEFIIKMQKPILYQVTDGERIAILPSFKPMKEMPADVLNEYEIQSTLSETMALIHVIEMNQPVKEARVPID